MNKYLLKKVDGIYFLFNQDEKKSSLYPIQSSKDKLSLDNCKELLPDNSTKNYARESYIKAKDALSKIKKGEVELLIRFANNFILNHLPLLVSRWNQTTLNESKGIVKNEKKQAYPEDKPKSPTITEEDAERIAGIIIKQEQDLYINSLKELKNRLSISHEEGLLYIENRLKSLENPDEIIVKIVMDNQSECTGCENGYPTNKENMHVSNTGDEEMCTAFFESYPKYDENGKLILEYFNAEIEGAKNDDVKIHIENDDVFLDQLPITKGVRAFAKRNNIDTLRELSTYSRKDLLNHLGIGVVTVDRLVIMLDKHNLKFSKQSGLKDQRKQTTKRVLCSAWLPSMGKPCWIWVGNGNDEYTHKSGYLMLHYKKIKWKFDGEKKPVKINPNDRWTLQN